MYINNLKETLTNDDGTMVEADRIFNFDETNISDDPGVKRCVFRRGVKYPERIQDSTKASTSLMFCGSAAGHILPPCLLRNATHLCQPLDVAFFGPLKRKWGGILDAWKTGLKKRCTSITKEAFPGLLKQLYTQVCGEERQGYSQNLVSGFKKCGIFPLDPDEVLSRLPDNPSASTIAGNSARISSGAGIQESMSDAVLSVLKEMRHGSGSIVRARKRSRMNVEPGKSISFEDSHLENIENDQSQSGHSSEVCEDSDGQETEMYSVDNENLPVVPVPVSDVSDERYLPLSSSVKLGTIEVGNWILVKFTDRKFYVGLVQTVYGNFEFTVKFMRHLHGPEYNWPEREDISDIEFPQVMRKLAVPEMGRRGVLKFVEKEQLSKNVL